MINKLVHDFKQRRIQKEFELLELEEMAAHAHAEINVVKAQRALEDAKVRQERAKDDAQMIRRWEEAKLRIQQKYLDAGKEQMNLSAEILPMTLKMSTDEQIQFEKDRSNAKPR